MGWRVRPTYDFTTLSTSIKGSERWAIDGTSSDYCWHKLRTGHPADHVSCTSDDNFKELERQEWKVKFSWGTIYGSVYCSAKRGNNNDYKWDNDSSNWRATYEELSSASGNKNYCWCQVTGYKPVNSDPIYGPKSVSSGPVWIYSNAASNCAYNCASACSDRAIYYHGF